MNRISPSLLSADFSKLGDQIAILEEGGTDYLHIDVMDGHFVPNISFGPDVVALAKRTAPGFYRNVHLMMNRPDLYLDAFAKAGAQTIQVHIEADCDLHTVLRRIREVGLRNAIVLNPETPVERLAPYLGEIDEALVMTVHPGYGGQKFIDSCLPKVAWLRERRPDLDVMVDGGVNGETALLAAKAGANQFVAGSYLFAQKDMAAAVADLRRRLA